MPRRRKEKLRSLTKEQVTIRVYPFGSDKPIPGFITEGMLDTVAGAPAKGIRIVIVDINEFRQSFDDWIYARDCILRQRYTNLWHVDRKGNTVWLSP